MIECDLEGLGPSGQIYFLSGAAVLASSPGEWLKLVEGYVSADLPPLPRDDMEDC